MENIKVTPILWRKDELGKVVITFRRNSENV